MMMGILRQLLTPFRSGDMQEETVEEALARNGFYPVEESNADGKTWSKKWVDGYLCVRYERCPDGNPLPDGCLWSMGRHHFNGGQITVRNLSLQEALALRLPAPIRDDGSPILIDTDKKEDLDVLWFMATRGLAKTCDVKRRKDNLISLAAARLKRSSRQQYHRPDNDLNGRAADIIMFDGNRKFP